MTRESELRSPPLGRSGLLLVTLGLLLVAGCLSELRNNGIYPTGFWNTDAGLVDLPFDAQLAVLVLGVVLLQLLPERFARTVLMVEGLAVLAAYGVHGAYWLGGLFVWFYTLEIPVPKPLRLLVPLALFVTAGLLCSRGITQDTYLFSLLFSCRLMLYVWDKWQRGWPKGDLGEYLFHFAAPPLLAFVPYIVIVPFYGTYSKRFAPRLSLARAREGFAHLGAGLLSSVLVAVIREYAAVEGPAYVLLIYVLTILQVGALAHVAHGLLLMHGLIDRPPLDKPLLATSYVGVWTRFQTHQKDMQMMMFFTPTLLRLRRANRYLAITAATAMALFVGSFAMHFLARYIYLPGGVNLGVTYLFLLLVFAVLAPTLCFQEWSRRTKRKAPRGILGVLYVVVSWSLTVAIAAILTMM